MLAERRNFAVCVQPLFKYSDVNQLVEMIELNRLLGAEYFYFYNCTISAAVSKALHYYTHLTDYVQVLPWQLSNPEWFGIANGQMAASVDCNNRVMQR